MVFISLHPGLGNLRDTVYSVSIIHPQVEYLVLQRHSFNSAPRGKRGREWEIERGPSFQFHIVFRFNYAFGRSRTVIIVVDASADLGRIFSSKYS